MNRDKELLDLTNEIHDAFAEIRLPKDVNISDGINIDHPDMETVFRGMHWRKLTLEFILEYNMAVCYFTPVAFRFYLPGYLRLILENPDDAFDVADWLMYYLTPSTKQDVERLEASEREAYEEGMIEKEAYEKLLNNPIQQRDTDYHNNLFREIISGLTSRQMGTVRESLEYMDRYFPYDYGDKVKKALEHF